jgi:hypothetical protein
MKYFIDIIDLIKKTNGDILGLFFFILLIIYFATKHNKTTYEIILLIGACIGVIVDLYITVKEIKEIKKVKKEKKVKEKNEI